MQSNSGQVFKVLLIEDNEGDIFLLKKSMENGEYPVSLTICKTGEEGLRRLRDSESEDLPDLVLVDLNLPGINGDMVLGTIKESDTLSDIPVVMLTSSQAPDDIRRAYQLHANGYVTKPLEFSDYDQLLSKLKHYWFKVVQLPPKRS